MKTIKRLFKNKKGIDTILAALLMVVIVVVASVMVYAWSTGLLGSLLVTPNVGKEALNAENYSFNTATNTNVTMYIRNTGSASVSFASYYVKDSAGNQYSKTSWTAGSASSTAPNGLAQPVLSIGTPYCTYQGTLNAFNTFSAGSSYTV